MIATIVGRPWNARIATTPTTSIGSPSRSCATPMPPWTRRTTRSPARSIAGTSTTRIDLCGRGCTGSSATPRSTCSVAGASGRSPSQPSGACTTPPRRADGTGDPAGRIADRAQIAAALDELKPEARAALVLRHYYGYDYAEIAALPADEPRQRRIDPESGPRDAARPARLRRRRTTDRTSCATARATLTRCPDDPRSDRIRPAACHDRRRPSRRTRPRRRGGLDAAAAAPRPDHVARPCRSDGTAPPGHSAASPCRSVRGGGRDHGRGRLRRCLAGEPAAGSDHRLLTDPDRRLQPKRSADGVTTEGDRQRGNAGSGERSRACRR